MTGASVRTDCTRAMVKAPKASAKVPTKASKRQGSITSFFRPKGAPELKVKKAAVADAETADVVIAASQGLKRKRRVVADIDDDDEDGDGNARDRASPIKRVKSSHDQAEATVDSGEAGEDEKAKDTKSKEAVVVEVKDVETAEAVEPAEKGQASLVTNTSKARSISFSVADVQPDDKHKDDDSEDEMEEEEEDEIKTAQDSAKKKGAVCAKVPVSRLTVDRTWTKGKPVPYKFLADAFSKVEEISGRLEIQAILSEVFRAVIDTTPKDLVPLIYLCVNKLAPAHEGIELGIGESVLLKALSDVTGKSVSALRALYKEAGDLGDVASSARTTQTTMFPPPPLTVRKVFAEFRAIAAITGKSTQDAKKSKIVKMLVAASKHEAKFIARALQGKLRIHLADKTVITALATAVTLEEMKVDTDVLLTTEGKKKAKLSKTEEKVEEAVKQAAIRLSSVYSQLPVWNMIVPKLLEIGTIDERLSEACKLVPGVPISPMLAKPTKAISEVLERFAESEFTCEYKYDGERAQVHRLADGTVKIYSRNAEDLTPKYPDLVAVLPEKLKDEFKDASFIIDAEAVAYDVEKKRILPFQELQSRKRKDVDKESVTVQVCVFAFDLLFFNGSSLLSESLANRRKTMMSAFDEREGVFMFAKGHDSRDPEEILELLNASIKDGCEGLMVKALQGPNGTYEPANRSQNWLKVKKDYLDGCGDTLDLVPIGGYLGRGKRTGTYGAFLLACYNPEGEEYQSICKIGTGFTDVDLETFANFYNEEGTSRTCDVPKPYYRISGLKALEPDVWFEPLKVWEVKCADLSISPQHTAAAGLVDPDKGIALRFPRFLREREDKSTEDATDSEQVAEFYTQQSSVANKGD